MDNIDLISIATIAFLGAFGHCIGMCGGIVIAYSSRKIEDNWSNSTQSLAHLTYSFGRITTYVMLGIIFGAIGGVVQFNGYTTAGMTIVAGIFMILAGLSLLGKIKFLTKLEHSFSQSKWYRDVFRHVLQSKSLYSFYILGLLNGLLPCGLVYFFSVTAASTGSPLWGALIMFIFGVSTIPAMFSLGFFTQLLNKGNMRKNMMNLASIIVILFGIYTIYRGYDFIENPDKSVLNCCDANTGRNITEDVIF
jgi:sulfite exporter TauE/SafE